MDETDRRILSILETDGRASFAEVGRKVGLSSGAVHDRVRRLEETHVIIGFRAVLDPVRLGVPLVAYILLNAPQANFAAVVALARSLGEVTEAQPTSGHFTFHIRIAVTDHTTAGAIERKFAALGETQLAIAQSAPVHQNTVMASVNGGR